MKNTKTISVSSVFPASPNDIWALLVKVETLRYIAYPYATFSPVQPDESMIWRKGATFRFRLRIGGVLPIGTHTIRVETFDHSRYIVETKEGNGTVPVWNHRIVLEPIDHSSTRYTDTVEIGAGALTGLVHIWSKAFYHHRQKKWMRLLSNHQN